jgi:broad specificity phosphatase PhoE
MVYHDRTTVTSHGQGGDVLLVRHAQSLSNSAWLSGGVEPSVVDTPLSPSGERQAQRLRTILREFSPDFIVSSPLHRALRTVELCSSWDWLTYVHAALQEHVTGPGDMVESPDVILTRYPKLRLACPRGIILNGAGTFSEPLEALDERIRHFSGWLKGCLGARVVVVGHRAYFLRWLNHDFGNCEAVRLSIEGLTSHFQSHAGICPTCKS